MSVVLMLVSYVVLLGIVFAAFVTMVRTDSKFEKWSEGFETNEELSLTFKEEAPDKLLIPEVWRRIRQIRLPKVKKIVVAVPQWD